MSVGRILTLGFGTFGGVNFLPTLGYGSGTPIPPTPNTGVPTLGSRSMRSLRHRKRLYDEREARKLTIAALYEEAKAIPELQAEAAAIVRPYARSEAEIPGMQTVDWKALKRDTERAGMLVTAWIAYLQRRQDDEIDEENREILLWL